MLPYGKHPAEREHRGRGAPAASASAVRHKRARRATGGPLPRQGWGGGQPTARRTGT